MQPYARSADEMDRRVTTVEVQLLNMSTKLDRHMGQTAALIETLDRRQDHSDVIMARMIGGLIVAQFLAILFAPAIRVALGLATTN
jgi:hypothetical protein